MSDRLPPVLGTLTRADRLLPPWKKEQDEVTPVRGRFFVATVLLTALFTAMAVPLHASTGAQTRAGFMLACLGLVLRTLALPWWTGRLRSAVHAYCAMLLVITVVGPFLDPTHARVAIAAI